MLLKYFNEKFNSLQAIFEALEDTIYHLRQQLRERDTELTAERIISSELRVKMEQLLKLVDYLIIYNCNVDCRFIC